LDFPKHTRIDKGTVLLLPGSATSENLFRGLRNALLGTGNVVLEASRGALDPVLDFAQSVSEGLSCRPRRLDCRFLYDARGSELYERITEQPEYYPTRTEAAILARHAPDIAGLTGPLTLVELGSGNSVKTDHLFSAYLRRKPSLCYIPVDVSLSALHLACRNLSRQRPGVRVVGIHGTYQEALPLFRATSPTMVIFLGSTIGNLAQEEASIFLGQVADHLAPGDYFLLGIDLVKSRQVLEAAYNDAAGVSEAFTRNLFMRMNRELGSTLDISSIEHLARYDSRQEQVEIHARFNRGQTINIAPLNRYFNISAGEKILVEISRKFRVGEVQALLEYYGMKTCRIFSDERKWFGLLLMQKVPFRPNHS
jgi:L-histidine N-alpha-methyltransferase